MKKIAKKVFVHKVLLIIQPILVLVLVFLVKVTAKFKNVGVTLMKDNHIKGKQIILRDCIYIFVHFHL